MPRALRNSSILPNSRFINTSPMPVRSTRLSFGRRATIFSKSAKVRSVGFSAQCDSSQNVHLRLHLVVHSIWIDRGERVRDGKRFDNSMDSCSDRSRYASRRGSLGTGFMPPSLDARFGSVFQHPNPAIRAERSRGWDAGVDQGVLGGRGTLSATYSRNTLRDLIGFQGAVYPELGMSVNVDRARTAGLE